MFMEMALKSSLWGEACYGNRSLAICLWNERLVHYYEKKCFMMLSLASSHPMRLSEGSFKNFRFKHTHVFILLKKCLLLPCSLDPWIIQLKNTVIFSHLNFQNRGFNLFAQNWTRVLTRQRQLEEMEEAGGIAQRSNVNGDCMAVGVAWESFILRAPYLCVL